MKLYHRTDHAKEILAEGFRDGRGKYMTDQEWEGVWLSEVPLNCNEGASGNTLMSIDIPDEIIKDCEWSEEDKTYREFLVPAEIVNRYGPPAIEETDENAKDPLPDHTKR